MPARFLCLVWTVLRLLYTYEALLGVPWVLLLDYWNLIMWKY